jgi:hypothetical protein
MDQNENEQLLRHGVKSQMIRDPRCAYGRPHDAPLKSSFTGDLVLPSSSFAFTIGGDEVVDGEVGSLGSPGASCPARALAALS